MKYELGLLVRPMNQELSTAEQFRVDPLSGTLEFHFTISWADFKVKVPKVEAFKKLIAYLLSNMRVCRQLVPFCEQKTAEQKEQSTEQVGSYDRLIELTNNYRRILLRNLQTRLCNRKYVAKIQELGAIPEQGLYRQNDLRVVDAQIDQLRQLFEANVGLMYRESLGFGEGHNAIKEKCLDSILYHSDSSYKAQSSTPEEHESKIVLGIEIVQKGKERLISREGSHSEITRGLFLYRLLKSIEIGVVDKSNGNWLQGNEKKTELTIKRCSHNAKSDASKNSFMNELAFLQFIRDHHQSFIAKYYLEMKSFQDRTETDPVFMKSYSENLDSTVRRREVLNVRQRLALIYQTSLGLCFLAEKAILHRDLKPQNIVVNSCLTPHIIDFGSCCSVHNSDPALGAFNPYDRRLLTTRLIHVHYHELPTGFSAVREKFTKQEYEQHPFFDVYSFGKVMSFVLFGKFEVPSAQQLSEEWAPFRELFLNFKFIIEMCLNVDPDCRPTIAEVTGFLEPMAKYYSVFKEKAISLTKQQVQ